MPTEMPSEQSQQPTESWSAFAALVAATLTAKVAAARVRAPQLARAVLVTRRYRWAAWMVVMAVIVGWDYGSDAASQASSITGLSLVALVIIEVCVYATMKAARGTMRVIKR